MCLPMQETWVQSLGQEDPLEKEMATQYSYLENPMDRGAWRGYSPWHGLQRVAKQQQQAKQSGYSSANC